MKTETILDAMLLTADADKFLSRSPSRYLRAQRQYHAFRDRMLRMDAEKDKYIDFLHKNEKALHKRITELEISEEKYRLYAMDLEEEKDKRIAELEAQLMLANSSSSIAHDLLEQRDKRIAELERELEAEHDWTQI